MEHVIVSGFARRFFEFRGRDRQWFSKRTLILLVSTLESLELRCKFQRALRPKKEEARQTAIEEGNYEWLPILWIIQSMGSHSCYYFVTMLAFSICSSSSPFFLADVYIGLSSHWANRGFSY